MGKFDIENFKELNLPEGQLDVFAIDSVTRAHGPEKRVSIWVRGCLKRCIGCTNSHMLEIPDIPKDLTIRSDLIRQIQRSKDSVAATTGITIQGGEPFLQARELAEVLKPFRQADNFMNVIVFSGYELSELQSFRSSAVDALLAVTDVLIDGEFELSQRDLSTIAGSINQNMHFLSPNLSGSNFARGQQETSYRHTENGVEFFISGIKT